METAQLLLDNLCHHPCPHSPTAFSESKPEALFNGNVKHEFDGEGGVFPRHDKILPLGEGNSGCHVPRSDIHLGLVVRDKRLVASALFFLQDVDLCVFEQKK